ncbi:retrovirus-related Pol polyprotein from type-1 retrotransposable element R1 isoform X1 [Episyrphus balteatus]|uniref:retrovirus-related Pol polyprotein from type-1 retrotransposable element R1 isoform X1 n=1 Tax=Episyrphus balteatus TaxID=286459 RepID=UPI00248655B4|nr:retrovirus-related Pol polyprotein from type-1 retrotransposable element R1 isoform X1 [Episyrphus balteatus]
MTTHFPGCVDSTSEVNTNPTLPSVTTEQVNPLITRENIAWAINTFSPYKSPGPDGILPIMLQNQQEIAVLWLEKIFKGCLLLNHVPKSWRQVSVVFIPKVGKRGHESAKDFRPISLTSFLLKSLERILETHIRDIFKRCPLASSQHAYMRGKSTETALHEVVRTIENSIHFKEYTLATFLDVEGAFNNVLPESILEALVTFEVEDYIRSWIISMLKERRIQASLGNSNCFKCINRGTPQGGVLSPLLWLLVMNNILVKLERSGVKAVAYADDLVVLVSGKFLPVISEMTDTALRKVSNWATSCGLGVNQSKTELMLFTTKTKIPAFPLPQLNGQILSLSSSAKYLGVILDTKLSWKLNIEERVRKASIAFYACSKTFGKKWGLKSKMILWTYTAVVRPILTYGAIVWWPALNKAYNINKLKKIQRTASVGTTGALRSCPTEALNVLLHLLPIDLHIKYQVSCSVLRLKETGSWKAKSFGHSDTTNLIPSDMLLTPTDYCTPILNTVMNCKVSFPSRSDWEEGIVTRGFDTCIFTDGSKMDCGVGSGVYYESLNISKSFRLPNFASVFQAELLAFKEACKLLRVYPNQSQNTAILTDSQAAIKAIDSVTTSSKLVQQCREELSLLSGSLTITLIWIPGHSGFEGNEKADELARQGSALHESLAEIVNIPIGVMKGDIFLKYLTKANNRWHNLTSCVISRKIWPTYNKSKTYDLISRPRKDISRIVAVCTGHWPIGEHAAKLGIPHNT